jgi:dTDP-4-dehydrorhamnose reductase
MAVILITGADGQLGNELRVLSKNYYGYNFIFTDINSLDITDPSAVRAFVENSGPDWIINCAAYNFVDKAESEPDRAMLINSTAVKNIADAIKDSECRLIHVSTDYVYNGQSVVPYDEHSPAEPMSAYGRSKLGGEKNALSHRSSMIIRTSWLYSSFGNNFVKTILRRSKEGGSIKVVYDQTGTPTYAGDLADAIIRIIAGVIRNRIAFYPGIYNYSNEGVCSWYDFAVEIISEAGLPCRVFPILTRDYPAAARRPAYSVLDKTRIRETFNLEIPHWRVSLKRCMELLK